MTVFARPRGWAWGLVLGVAVIAGALSLVALRTRNAEFEALREQVVSLSSSVPARQTVREVRTIVREQSAPNGPHEAVRETGQAKEAASSEVALTPEEERYRADVVVAAQDKLLDDAYRSERPDPQWASQATEQLRAAYTGKDFESLSIEGECRSTMCRVTFSYTKPEGEFEWRRLMERPPWPGATNASVNFQTRQGVFYLSRAEFELPRVDAATLVF